MAIRSFTCAVVALSGQFLLGCGGAATQAPAPVNDRPLPVTVKTDEDEPSATKQEAVSDEKVPAQCAKNDPCQPPVKWVESLCHDVYPGLGLYLFQQGLPWGRRYLTHETDAVNASGGATLEGKIEFDEEVLVLKVRKAELGGMQVSGSGESYLALRWNGSCVTLDGSDLTTRVPPSPKSAYVNWRFIDDSIQEMMKEDPAVLETYRAWRKECKGAASGETTKACATLDKKLSVLVVQYVRKGGKVPVPLKLP